MAITRINHMVDERCGKVVFGTCLIQILIIDTYFYGALLFIHRDRVGHSRGLGNWVDEPCPRKDKRLRSFQNLSI